MYYYNLRSFDLSLILDPTSLYCLILVSVYTERYGTTKNLSLCSSFCTQKYTLSWVLVRFLYLSCNISRHVLLSPPSCPLSFRIVPFHVVPSFIFPFLSSPVHVMVLTFRRLFFVTLCSSDPPVPFAPTLSYLSSYSPHPVFCECPPFHFLDTCSPPCPLLFCSA